MATVLHIQASPRGESYSRRLAEAFLEAFVKTHPGFAVEALDLFQADIPEFRAPQAKAKYAILSGAQPKDEAQAAWKTIIRTIEHFKRADAYVVSSPMWNFGIPYRLKQYLDVIVQPELTFTYTAEDGYNGLVTDKPVVLCLARGGEYKKGTGAEFFDFQRPYLETIFGFIGFTDIQTVVVEPTLQGGIEAAEAALKKAIPAARKLAPEIKAPAPA